jgi:predicted permease
MLRELRIALRRLVMSPSFTLPALATLTIGIGGTIGIFGTMNATVLRPLPYPESENLFTVNTARVDGGWSSGSLTSAEIAALKSRAPSIAHVVGTWSGSHVALMDDGRSREAAASYVTDGFFDLVGLPMAVGRTFRADELVDGSLGPAVLSHRLWNELYGADSAVIGSTLRFAAGPATIVGVAPAELDVPSGTDIWLSMKRSDDHPVRSFEALVRVHPGSGPGLERELSSVMAEPIREDPASEDGLAFVATPLVNRIVGDLRPVLYIAMTAALVLLALSCANAATLMLVRRNAQTQELALRKVLGASQGRLVKQTLAEAGTLAALATAAGIVMAYSSARSLRSLAAEAFPRFDYSLLDPRMVLFTLTVLIGSTMVVGVLPAVAFSSLDLKGLLGEVTRSATGGRSSRRVLSGLIAAEIAFATFLVAGAGWLVRSYAQLSQTDPGFEARGRVVFRSPLFGSSYFPLVRLFYGESGESLWQPDRSAGRKTPRDWLAEVSDQLGSLDQVTAVGMGSALPFRQNLDGPHYVAVPGEPYDPDAEAMSIRRQASPQFFDAMGVRLVAGRTFAADEPSSSVIVNEAFVRAFLGGRDPLVSSFAWGQFTVDLANLRSIVGVVADVRFESLQQPAEPTFYTPDYASRGSMAVATTLDDVSPILPEIQARVRAVDPSIPVEVESLEAILESQLARYRLGALLMNVFALVSLALAGVGIYGIVGHSMSLRAKEFAVRMALGEQSPRAAMSVLRQGGTVWMTGLVAGIGAVYVVGQWVAGVLYQARADDPVILLLAAGSVTVLVLVAYLVPALKMSRMRIGEVLRVS